MFILIAQGLVLCILSSALWPLLRNQIVKSPLHDLPGPPSVSSISGNLKQLFNPNSIPWHHEMTKQYGRIFKFYGLFGDKQVYVTDPRALHHIIVKDQDIYEPAPISIEASKFIFGQGIFSTLGDHHKKQRKMLNPVFSTAHMRNLLPIFSRITNQVRDGVVTKVKDGPHEIDMFYWLSINALESIGQAGLGYSLENAENETPYARAIKDTPPIFFRLAVLLQFLQLCPAWFGEFFLQFIPSRDLQRAREIVDIMHNMAVEVFTAKKQALSEGGEAMMSQVGEGKDIMSVLLRANAVGDEADRLPESEILAQMNSFVIAANETTSHALARIFHLLALNPEAQTRLRQEVIEARGEDDLTYDELVALPYLDAVVRESMRLYAPVTFVSRTTGKDVVLPLGTPVKSTNGQSIHKILLKKNTNIVIGIAAANRDREIWGDDAEMWKPERWIGHQEYAKERLPGVYSGMMTFLGGGRGCIGFKFAELQIKVVVSILLENLVFEPSSYNIVWQTSITAKPVTKGRENETSHLPLRVSLAKAVST